MLRNLKNPCESLVPRIRPEDAVGLYLTSKQFEKERKAEKPLDFEKARDSVLLDLVRSKRALMSSDERLKEARNDRKVKRAEIERQRNELREKQAELRASFTAFEKFVKENEEKRRRAQVKIEREKEVAKVNEEGAKNILEENEKLLVIKKVLEDKVKDYVKFEDYLKGCVGDDKNFKSIEELIQTYNSLTIAKETLSEMHENRLMELEKLRKQMLNLIGSKTVYLNGLNNDLKTMENRYLKAVRDGVMWEETVQNILKDAAALASEISTVKASINETYRDMCRRQKIVPEFKSDDFKNQLKFIKSGLKQFCNFVETAHVHKLYEDMSV